MVLAQLEDEAHSGIIKFVVHTERERAAARLFLAWFRSRRGRATKVEVSRFADKLASGELSSRYGRTTFYGFVLKPFIDNGLICLDNELDHASRKVIKTYKRIIQPTQRRRPSGPSLLYNAHRLAEEWNGIFGK